MPAPRPNLVTRREWGARPPRSVTRLPRSFALGVALHYSGGAQPARHSQCAAVVRSFQALHMAPGGLGAAKGGSDIAYTHVICPHGYTFRGRGIDVRTGANGSEAGNDRFYAVCMIGLDNPALKDVTPEARRELLRYLEWMDSLIPRAIRVPPHSAFRATGCPGAELRALVRNAGWPA